MMPAGSRRKVKTIHTASADDLDDILRLLNEASAWLKSRGLKQWGRGFGPDKIGPMVDRREVYIVREGDRPVATGATTRDGDTDFWTPAELGQPSAYLNKVAIDRAYAGQGIGALLIRWLVDHAARGGAEHVRLDVWRTNTKLHAYYEFHGWTYLRTVFQEHRRSGALFQRPAEVDPIAREVLSEA